MWTLYDRLLQPLPGDAVVRAGRITPIWTMVEADCGPGLAMTPPQPYRLTSLRGRVAGMGLRELAGYVKSWDFYEAALGLAAINAWYNTPALLEPDPRRIVRGPGENSGVFGGFDRLVKGKRVTIIGHGPHVEALSPICRLSVLERLPTGSDLPDPACEYLLPQQDYVFITATALENKTMPRLLELTRNCCTVIWGPSTPLTETLLDAGADALLGNVVLDPEQVGRIAGEGGFFQDFRAYTRSVLWFRDAQLAKRLQ